MNIGEEMRRSEISVANQTIATYVWGDPAHQPYALLVHGWSSFGLRFLPWVARLRAAGLAVVTFDQPGHGYSTGELCTLPNFVSTIRAIGRFYGNPALAIGHSLGGAALTLAQAEDWHAERIVVIAPPADMETAAERFMQFMHLGSHLRERFLEWHERATGINVRDLHVRQHLRALGLPCLIVHDLHDLRARAQSNEDATLRLPLDSSCGVRVASHPPSRAQLALQSFDLYGALIDDEFVDAAIREEGRELLELFGKVVQGLNEGRGGQGARISGAGTASRRRLRDARRAAGNNGMKPPSSC